MSFLLRCPSCGRRDVNEFVYAGEITHRPDGSEGSPSPRELNTYVYIRRNVAGVQREWWYHRHGCELWFLAERDTRSNEVHATWFPGPRAGEPGGGGPAVAAPAS